MFGSGKSTLINDILHTSLDKQTQRRCAGTTPQEPIGSPGWAHVTSRPSVAFRASNFATTGRVRPYPQAACRPEAKCVHPPRPILLSTSRVAAVESRSATHPEIEMNFRRMYVPCETCHGKLQPRNPRRYYKGKHHCRRTEMPVKQIFTHSFHPEQRQLNTRWPGYIRFSPTTLSRR